MKAAYDFVIAGGGIIGMAVADTLTKRYPGSSILVMEKEQEVAQHASGRNSGVLHAGFYYTADSLKAKFTVDGNRRMKEFCSSHGLTINACQKVVVARNEMELKGIYELEARGKRNGVNVSIIDEQQLREIDPNARTFGKALFSPTTATVDPKAVCAALKKDLQQRGVEFACNCKMIGATMKGDRSGTVVSTQGSVDFGHFFNCAGLYADKIAQYFGVGKEYTVLPFKGLYLKYTRNSDDVRTNIYPVPNLLNPFLGVHFTKTVSGAIKIGPTAIPALWREHYDGFANFNFAEFVEVLSKYSVLFVRNAFNFRRLAFLEMRKYFRSVLVGEARSLVGEIRDEFAPLPSGIRAQLLNVKTCELVMDFLVETQGNTTHVLNSVSPAFTCSFAFADYIVDRMGNRAP